MQDILIDTNILMLLIMGSWNRNAISAFRRTKSFVPSDFDLLQSTLTQYGKILTMAGVLTEVSNLMGNDFHQQIASGIVAICTPFVEVLKAKEAVFEQEGFSRLGFSDASILSVLSDEIVLLTDDLQLYLQAEYQGFQAVNFNHLRKFKL